MSGQAGTAQTIKVMRQLVDQAQTDPEFVRTAVDIIRNVPAFDDAGEVRAIFNWVRSNIRFTKDPFTKEKLYPPQELLKIRAGDCDDIAMLLGALLLATGYPARLVTVSANPEAPDEFSHVYVETEIPPGSGAWIALDAARADSRFGLEPSMYYRKRAWSLADDSYQDLSGSTRLRGLSGLGDSNIDWGSVLQQTIQEVPAIMATAAGGSSSVQTAAGTASTAPNPYTNPYGSFATQYTPGYGIAPAGYSSVYATAGGSPWPWIIGAGLLLYLMRK